MKRKYKGYSIAKTNISYRGGILKYRAVKGKNKLYGRTLKEIKWLINRSLK